MNYAITQFLLVLISVIRIAIGIAPFIASRFAVAAMKLPSTQIHSSTALLLRLFGVREVAVGVLTLIFRNEAALLTQLLTVNLLVDLGDAITFLLVFRSDSSLKTTAKMQGVVALLAVASWSITLFLN